MKDQDKVQETLLKMGIRPPRWPEENWRQLDYGCKFIWVSKALAAARADERHRIKMRLMEYLEHPCQGQHEDDPCCHTRTAGAILDWIKKERG